MSWVTLIWGALIGGCAAMALPYFIIGIWRRRIVYLLFVMAVAAVIAIAVLELATMRSTSVEHLVAVRRWTQLPVFVLVVTIFGFVHFYFGTGRLWLGLTACALRFVCLLTALLSPYGLNFRVVTGLRNFRFLGEIVSAPVGVISPRTQLANLSALLLLIFVVDASLKLWRRGKAEDRRRAAVVGGSITFFILLAAGETALIHLKIIQAPYLVSLPFAAIIAAMGFELSYEMFAAAEIARRLHIAEEQARRQRQEIDRMARTNLLGEMAASIGHELNQPLSGIMNYASAGQRFIDRGDLDPQKLRGIFVDVSADAQRAHNVIQNIRNTLKKGAFVRELVNLNDIVMNVVRMVHSDSQAYSCEVKVALADGLPPIEIDQTQIQQVLINLLGNAFDAMRQIPANRRIVEITTAREGDKEIRVTVRDHGIGLPEERRERLFEQFFTTKADGLGLGLAIVRSIIEAHGGKITAENVSGGGARFDFVLPSQRILRA